jgi:hypothetical protein
VNLRSKRHIVGTTFETDEVPFRVELVVDANHSFYGILLEAIDDADPAANRKSTSNG